MSVTLVIIIALAISLAACSGQLLPGNSNFAPGKPGKMTVAVKGLKNMGRDGDTELAHVNPAEKRMLKKMGGSGTINPKTGLREFKFGGGGHGASSESRSADRGNRDRDGGRGARAPSKSDWAKAVESLGPSKAPERSWADGLDDRGGVEIERRKSVINVAPGDERGGQSQRDGRDGALILNVSVEPGEGGELGGGKTSTPGKKDEERRGEKGARAAILSGAEGIRDKLGRSGRRGVGKSLG